MYVKTLSAAIGLAFSAQALAVGIPQAPAAAGLASFGDYFMRPSSDGATIARNVIVWEPESGSCYVARTWFTNTLGLEVRSADEVHTPDTIFVWQMLCGDASNVTYELEYVYAVPFAGFDHAQGAEINQDVDGDGSFDDITSWDYRFSSRVNPLLNVELRHLSDLYRDASGELVAATSFSTMVAELGEPLTVNGMTFNDVAAEHFVGFQRIRFHARGIGAIYEINPESRTGLNSDPLFDQQSSRKVIFYRAEGASPSTRGSLAGTPFASGDMIHQWVQ